MADLQPPEGLRDKIADAIPYGLISTPAVGIGDARRQKLADVMLAALFEACTVRERWLVKHLNGKGRSVWTRSFRDRTEAEQVEASNRDVAARCGDRSVLLRKLELSWTQPPPVVPDDSEKGAGDG